jgi:hypothetical protein
MTTGPAPRFGRALEPASESSLPSDESWAVLIGDRVVGPLATLLGDDLAALGRALQRRLIEVRAERQTPSDGWALSAMRPLPEVLDPSVIEGVGELLLETLEPRR